MAKVGTGKGFAGIARATLIQGRKVFSEAGVFNVPAIALHQGAAVAGKTGWNHAVEQINASGDRLCHFPVSANSH